MGDKKLDASIIYIILLQMQIIDCCNSSTCTYVNFVVIIYLHSCYFPYFTNFLPTSTILRSFADISSSTTVRVCGNSGNSQVDTKPDFQANLSTAERHQNSANIEIRSDSDSDNYSYENTIPIQIVENRRYIRETSKKRTVNMFQKTLIILVSIVYH